MSGKFSRLKKQTDFTQIRKRGRTATSRLITLRWAQLDKNNTAVAIVASQKISKKAVIRNRAKRRLRSIINKFFKKIKTGNSIIIIARPPIIEAKHKELLQDMHLILQKAKLLK
ncbi:ribonuclease P protein component [Patescibacteria group bacterium]